MAWTVALLPLTTPCSALSPLLQLPPQTQAHHLVPTSGPLYSNSLLSALAQLFPLGPWGAAVLATFYEKVSLGVCFMSPRALELACLDLNPSSTSYETLCLSFSISKTGWLSTNIDPGTFGTYIFQD